jgi:AraC family transcriptional regulator of arabinose operon
MEALAAESLQLNSSYGKVICEANWKWNRSGIPFDDFDIWYVWKGEGEVILNGAARKVRGGTCYLFKPGDRVEAAHIPENPLTVTYIHFTVQHSDTELMALSSWITDTASSFLQVYLDRFVAVMMAREVHYDIEARLLLKLILLAYQRSSLSLQLLNNKHNHRHYPAMAEIASFIRENPGAVSDIATLAAKAYLSPRYFSLKFKEIMGQTIESYIIDQKIERAEYLLRYHGMSVSEVSDALGYQSIYFFSRQFKKVRGYSPSRVRG